MRRFRVILFLPLFLPLVFTGGARADSISNATNLITGRVAKVLPFFLDTNNEVATSPSLFDRDAYQHYLLEHSTNAISGLRFDVHWSAHHAGDAPLKLRVELRGVGAGGFPTQTVLEQPVTSRTFHHWTSLTLNGTNYTNFGALSAWRATLWNGDQLLGEQKSFLW